MNELQNILKEHIAQHGPMDIGQFMSLALAHPDHGYYIKGDPLGRGGDFTTAPEVSQMFGEIVGAWAAHIWMQMGSPERFIFLECGPGRGTLMADALRGSKGVAGFHDALDLHLLEISPVLRTAQEQALAGYDVSWHATLDSVPDDCPVIMVANEFFDALPFRQLMFKDGAWHERVIGVDNDGEIAFGLRQADPFHLRQGFGGQAAQALQAEGGEGDIYEFSPQREAVMRAMCGRMKAHGGAALIIDYGHLKTANGDTFQAVYKHDYCDVLAHIGDADLSSHVDFDALHRCAEDEGVIVDGLDTQGAFLKALGVEARAAYLSDQGGDQIAGELERLTGADQMGDLFKVMSVKYGF